jgi:hypothetical protein
MVRSIALRGMYSISNIFSNWHVNLDHHYTKRPATAEIHVFGKGYGRSVVVT